jgi:dipeptidase E
MKLFLYSFAFTFSDEQSKALSNLVGKPANRTTFALIDNAADIIPDSAGWIEDARNTIRSKGYQTEVVDLREWEDNAQGLRNKLTGKDVIWVGGGNTFYLRWLMQKVGADKIITDLVAKGTVYAGWSAGAIVAGPTLECIEHMEDTEGVPEIVRGGLNLTSLVVVPHIGNKDFAEAAATTNNALKRAGYTTQPLTDTQALVIDGDKRTVI